MGLMQNEQDCHEIGLADASFADFSALPETRSSTLRGEHGTSRVADTFDYRVLKRSCDLLLVTLLLLIFLPAMVILGILVKLTSPGPVFFSHRRIYKDGSFFSMWKFRTMCVNSAEVLERHLSSHPEARAEWTRTHKLVKDPRVTRIGDIMRRYSLDELPQLWNVFTGRMSLVGPRPIVAAEVEKYGKCFYCYTSVKPGVTGLWQVSGRSRLTYQARVKLDCQYAAGWTLLADFGILLKTLRSVANQEGAY